jgi:hypothetical protein
MARLDLATRAARLADNLAGRSMDALPKYLQRDLDRFTRAIGIDVATFTGYAPSTRRRYIHAAQQGRTAAQERARVREQRKAREVKKQSVKVVSADQRKLDEIRKLQKWLIEWGIDTSKGQYTQVDKVRAEVLLSDEGISAHIRVYGIDYVLEHLRGMKEGAIDKRVATARWQAFKASDFYPDEEEDERWFWYHAVSLHYSGDIIPAA